MKRMIVSFSALALSVLLAGCAGVRGYVNADYDFSALTRVAVADVQMVNGSEADKNQIATYFKIELLGKGYNVVDRSKVQQILQEQEFQTGEITTPEGAAKAGRILNVDAVVLVNVPELGERITISAEMVDVEDGTVIWADSDTGSTGRTLATVGGALAGATAGVVLGGSRSGKVVAGVAGGLAGGILGQALTPAVAKKVRRIVTKLCKNLPARTAGS